MSELRKAAQEALFWMQHARLHLTIKERMHPDGLSLYDSAAEALRAALAKPEAEEVEREREAVLSLADSEATTLIAVAEHLRSRQEFTGSELHMAKAQALVEFRAAIRAKETT